MTDKEVMKQALEALEGLFGNSEKWESGGVAVWRLGGVTASRKAITALEAALEQPEQEPLECLDCGSHNVGIPSTYDSAVDSVKTQPEQGEQHD